MAAQRVWKRKQARVAATVQLVSGIDDDLIAWWRSVPKGEGNQALKTVLRRGLALPEPPDATSIETELVGAFQRQLDELHGAVAQIPRLIEASTAETRQPDTEALVEWMQLQLSAFATELRRVEALALGTQTPNGQPVQDETPAAPVLDDDRLQRRQNRLKKSSW